MTLPTVEIRDHVAHVTLNRPDARNALSRAVNEELRRLAAALGDDPEVRAVVLTGAGDQAFCAGADLKERKGVPAHVHYDVRFLLEIALDYQPIVSEESHDVQWVELSQVAARNTDESVLRMVSKTPRWA